MATASIHQAATSKHLTAPQPAQDSSGPPNAFQALLSLADIPDPGGGPPAATAEAGASNPGPNAQSNQPDLLPLLSQPAGAQTATPGILAGETTATGRNPAQVNPLLLIPAAANADGNGPPFPRTTGLPTGGPSDKKAKVASTDAALVALAGLTGITPLSGPAGAAVAGSAAPGPASTELNAAGPSNPVNAPASVVPAPPARSQTEATLRVTVDSPAQSTAPRELPLIKNAAVSAVAGSDGAVASITASDTGSQASSGNSTGDRASNQQLPTPDPGGAGLAGQLPVSDQAMPIHATPAAAGSNLSATQRLDVIRQVADRIELMAAARPQQGVTIHLQPHGLGDVTIVVKGIGRDIEATFSASNEAVRTALSDSRDALNQAVTAKGYNLVGVNIAAHAQSMSGRDRQPSQNQQQPSQAFGNPSTGGGPSGGGNTRGGALPSTAMTSAGTEADAELHALADEGVDYRI